MAISYDLLHTFTIAASRGNFSLAARDLRISVSAISQKVRALEAQLGVPLFERAGRRVRLLAAGEALRATLKADFARIDEALAGVKVDFMEVRGRVAIGAPRAFGAHWLRPRLPPLLNAHEQLSLDLEFDVPSVLERRLAEGLLDLVLLVRPTQLPGIEAVPIAKETFHAVAAPRYVKRWGQPLKLSDFQSQRWAVFDRDLAMHAPWWRATFGARAPLPTNLVYRVASLAELLALAEAGVAIAVLPDYLAAPAIASGRVLRLDPANRRRSAANTIFLAWRAGVTPSARLRAVRDALLTS